jgi:hypothetical protein
MTDFNQFGAMFTPNLKTIHIITSFFISPVASIMSFLSNLRAPRLRHISFTFVVYERRSVEDVIQRTWDECLEIGRFLDGQASHLICEVKLVLSVSLRMHTPIHQKFAETFPFIHSRQMLQFVYVEDPYDLSINGD